MLDDGHDRGDRVNRRRTVLAAMVVMTTVALAAACSSGSASAARPTTTARLQITSPTPNQVTGPDLSLELNLIGAKVVPAASGPLRPDEGHIHVSVDGKLVSMTYGTTQDLHGLTPGSHSVQAEFVATDHAPFRNRVVAAVLFQVQDTTAPPTAPT
ncbi:MAG: hypothetical protein ABR511_08160 [Acidimicrobiales bacterium]